MKNECHKESLSHRPIQNASYSFSVFLLVRTSPRERVGNDSSKKKNRNSTKKGKLIPYLTSLITLLGILVSVTSTAYWNYKQEKDSQSIQRARVIYQEIAAIRARTALQEKLANRLNVAINQLIVLRAVSKKNCNRSGAESNQDDPRRVLLRGNLMDLSYEAKAAWGQCVYNEIQNLIKLDHKGTNVCSKNSASESSFRFVQEEINERIYQVKYAHQMKIAALQNRVTLLF